MSDNPFQPPEPQAEKDLTARQAYNVATDIVTGPNFRLRDNLIQAFSILVCLVLGALIGPLVAGRGAIPEGVILGGFAGLLVGLFGSGIVLMIYRAVSHARGKHD